MQCQYGSLRMIHRAWKEDYNILLQRSGLQSLSDRRKYLKLCYFLCMVISAALYITPETIKINYDYVYIRNPYIFPLCIVLPMFLFL